MTGKAPQKLFMLKPETVLQKYRFCVYLKIMFQEFEKEKYYDESVLMSAFNGKDSNAYAYVYDLYYNELFFFAVRLYGDTVVEPSDAVQDVFLSLWHSGNVSFCRLTDIKAYLFVALNNNCRRYHSRLRYSRQYQESQKRESDRFETAVVESEMFAALHQMLGVLSAESAEIMRLFLQGWNADEIAEKLGKTKRTIYNKKSEAIAILRRKLPKELLSILLPLL